MRPDRSQLPWQIIVGLYVLGMVATMCVVGARETPTHPILRGVLGAMFGVPMLGLIAFNIQWTLTACETLAIVGEQLTITLRVGKWQKTTRTFDLKDVADARIAVKRYRYRGGERIVRVLAFDYRGALIEGGVRLSETDAVALRRWLRAHVPGANS